MNASSALGAACIVVVASCSREREPEGSAGAPNVTPSSKPHASARNAPPARPPELLYLPEAEETLPPPFGDGLRAPGAPLRPSGRCPPDMVDVRGAFCIDRYEISLVDSSGRALSPYYHPTLAQTRVSYQRYGREPVASGAAPFPEPPAFQLSGEFVAAARSLPGVVPSGYLSGDAADAACRAAGKRLCTLEEWRTACRGERDDRFPYGDSYEAGTCNVFREAHPAVVLHGNASRHHLDPRLNRVSGESGPLLRVTGGSASCRSSWGADAAWDLVGNLDEWVADGSFAGGFYSRATKEGCEARISSHPPSYFDYSLGGRCCR